MTAIPANQLNQVISTPGKVQQATINVAGQLKTTVDLEPFSEDTTFNGTAPEWQGGFTAPHQSDDIIFAGTGNATVHGGSGDDAISGGQALPVSYLQTEDHYSGNLTGIAESDWYHPYNPGDALRFNPIDPSGTHSPKEVGRTGEFALYNEFDPRRKILLNADGTASTTGTGLPWLLDLNAGEKDGNDVLFGDLGNNPPMTAALGLEGGPLVPSTAVATVFSTLSATFGLLSAATINETLRSDYALLLELSSWMSSTIAEWWPGSGPLSDSRAMSLALPGAAGFSGAWSSIVGDPTSDSLLSSLLIDELLSEVAWLQQLRYRL